MGCVCVCVCVQNYEAESERRALKKKKDVGVFCRGEGPFRIQAKFKQHLYLTCGHKTVTQQQQKKTIIRKKNIHNVNTTC